MMTIMAGTIVGVHHRGSLLHIGWGMECPDLEVFFDLIVVQSPTEVHIGEEDLQMALATFGNAHAYCFMFQLLMFERIPFYIFLLISMFQMHS